MVAFDTSSSTFLENHTSSKSRSNGFTNNDLRLIKVVSQHILQYIVYNFPNCLVLEHNHYFSIKMIVFTLFYLTAASYFILYVQRKCIQLDERCGFRYLIEQADIFSSQCHRNFAFCRLDSLNINHHQPSSTRLEIDCF